MNRSMGLLDIVPDVFVAPWWKNSLTSDELVQLGRAENGALGGQPTVAAAG